MNNGYFFFNPGGALVPDRLHFMRRRGEMFIAGGSLLLLLFCISIHTRAQDQKLAYSVMRNGDAIGHLNFRESRQGNLIRLFVESEVRTRFIFLIVVSAREETVYKDGLLTFSSMYRTLNGKEKANIETKLVGNEYQVNKAGSTEHISAYPISYNLLAMYNTEPKQATRVFADLYSVFLPIKKTGPHEYKITFPDGNYNNYWYRDGVCSKVEVHNSLYTLQFLLMK